MSRIIEGDWYLFRRKLQAISYKWFEGVFRAFPLWTTLHFSRIAQKFGSTVESNRLQCQVGVIFIIA